ncbi:hypothetical protein OHC33_007267 [Knufia fluminis]|uniref:Beta-lactamase/transpeptidase-like protein n=1 Tax=Knufia fluminis TaxID=191047 RepID=A0AAN8I4E4_9EURO|nr:hypothetical protein OHC33_007267 [Knufia fluminis]
MTQTNIASRYVTEDFNKMFLSQMKERKILGASLGIVQDDEIFTKGYGTISPNGSSASASTLYDAASMSKSFTAAAIAVLIDDKENKHPDTKITWNTPVSHLMRDDFVLNDPYLTEHVTIKDVLSHRTGIPGHDDASVSSLHANELGVNKGDDVRSTVRKLRHFPAVSPLRTKWIYNNFMYTAAAHLVATIAGQSFEEFLAEKFWKPLGMTNTYFCREGNAYSKVPADHIATGNHWHKDNQSWIDTPFTSGPEGIGAGEIISCVSDWALWLRAMMQPEKYLSHAVSKDTLSECHKPLVFCDAPQKEVPEGEDQYEYFYGMGWDVEYYRGVKVICHGGMVPGFTSFMCFIPSRKFGFVIFGNTNGIGEASDVIAHRLMDDCLGVPTEQRRDWAQIVRDRVKKEEDEEDEKDEDEDVYPDRPEVPLPMALKAEEYAGRYENPGYGVFVVQLKKGELFIDATDRTFPFEARLEHVSGEYFVMKVRSVPYEYDTAKIKAEFVVGASGKVTELRLSFEEGEGAKPMSFVRAES